MIPCCLFEPPPSRYNFLKIQSMLFFLILLSLWILLFTPWSGSLHVLLVLPSAATPSTSSSSQFLCESPQRPLGFPPLTSPGARRGWWDMAPMWVSWEECRWATSGPHLGHICATPPAPWGLLVLAVRAGLSLNSVLILLLFSLSLPSGSLGQIINAIEFLSPCPYSHFSGLLATPR